MRYERHSSFKNLANGLLALLSIAMMVTDIPPASVQVFWLFFLWPSDNKKGTFDASIPYPMLLAITLWIWGGAAARAQLPQNLDVYSAQINHIQYCLNVAVCLYILAISLPPTLLPIQATEILKKWWPIPRTIFIFGFIATAIAILFTTGYVEQFAALFLTWALFGCFAFRERRKTWLAEVQTVLVVIFFAVAGIYATYQFGIRGQAFSFLISQIGLLIKLIGIGLTVRMSMHFVESTKNSITFIRGKAPQSVLQTIKINTTENDIVNFLSEENHNA